VLKNCLTNCHVPHECTQVQFVTCQIRECAQVCAAASRRSMRSLRRLSISSCSILRIEAVDTHVKEEIREHQMKCAVCGSHERNCQALVHFAGCARDVDSKFDSRSWETRHRPAGGRYPGCPGPVRRPSIACAAHAVGTREAMHPCSPMHAQGGWVGRRKGVYSLSRGSWHMGLRE